jgi:hypothetical protein
MFGLVLVYKFMRLLGFGGIWVYKFMRLPGFGGIWVYEFMERPLMFGLVWVYKFIRSLEFGGIWVSWCMSLWGGFWPLFCAIWVYMNGVYNFINSWITDETTFYVDFTLETACWPVNANFEPESSNLLLTQRAGVRPNVLCDRRWVHRSRQIEFCRNTKRYPRLREVKWSNNKIVRVLASTI